MKYIDGANLTPRNEAYYGKEAKRQKQLAKKKAKREDKHAILARINSVDPTVRLANVEKWPVAAALVPTELWDRGMGQLSFRGVVRMGGWRSVIF